MLLRLEFVGAKNFNFILFLSRTFKIDYSVIKFSRKFDYIEKTEKFELFSINITNFIYHLRNKSTIKIKIS
jgi:hypothetical protein